VSSATARNVPIIGPFLLSHRSSCPMFRRAGPLED
jgi:hypothetical protein